MSNSPTPEIPATYIHMCNDVRVFVDEEAFSKVKKEKTFQYWSYSVEKLTHSLSRDEINSAL